MNDYDYDDEDFENAYPEAPGESADGSTYREKYQAYLDTLYEAAKGSVRRVVA
jgi:hypothetical protein